MSDPTTTATEEATNEAVWQHLRTLMPRHTCGRRMEPGGAGDTPMVVCVPCAYVEEVDPDWANRLAAEARGHVANSDGAG